MNGFKTCTTDQLTLQEKQGICTLISQIFGIERTVEYFDREFSHNCKKYSYHCIYQKDSQVLASFCIVPRRYKVAGRTEFFGLSVDTAVSPEAHLGPFGIADMAAEAEALAQKDGCKVLYGFPNDNFYELHFFEILTKEDINRLKILKKENFINNNIISVPSSSLYKLEDGRIYIKFSDDTGQLFSSENEFTLYEKMINNF